MYLIVIELVSSLKVFTYIRCTIVEIYHTIVEASLIVNLFGCDCVTDFILDFQLSVRCSFVTNYVTNVTFNWDIVLPISVCY